MTVLFTASRIGYEWRAMRALAVMLCVLAVAATSGCATAPCECAIDEERIARRVAELLEERGTELADTSGDEEDGADDAPPAGAAHGPTAPPPASPAVAAVPFSNPADAPAVRPPPHLGPRAVPRGEPEPRVFIPPGGSPSRGPDNALVTVIAFVEFECPFSARTMPVLDELLRRYPADVRIVFKHFPLSFHRHARAASEAAIEAFVQGGSAAFWRMHDLMFANGRALERADLVRYATEAGLDAGRLDAAVQADIHAAALDADIALGTASGVLGTPTFYFNGTRVVGALPIEAFVTAVDAELVVARAELARGTPRARLYETIANGRQATPRRPRGPR